jgi:endoglucanase
MDRRIRRLVLLGIIWLVVLITLPLTSAGAATSGWSPNGPSIITPGGTTFIISGVNWYGFETTSFVIHGLFSQDYHYIVDEIKQYGYNTVRIPYSNQMWESDPVPGRSTVSTCPTCLGSMVAISSR